ncbi:MAG: YaiI/YqxD family protein [Spirochaetae bacterium HGW-Spirochaetae-3]|nr:MAG: YaiI/YqxD family protein [Spirochaetae bacterium HGW-Spirochaetae-3]
MNKASPTTRLYVDGDAFPNRLKSILVKAVGRLGIACTVVSNKRIAIGESPSISYILVPAGADLADDAIVEIAGPGDLAVTADIPLADRLVEKGVRVIDHRGKIYTSENIKSALALRDLMQDIRDSGGQTRGPAVFSQKDAHAFACALDRIMNSRRG